MKRIHALLAFALCVALVIVGIVPVTAETVSDARDYAPQLLDITKEADMPVKHALNMRVSVPDGMEQTTRTAGCTYEAENQETVRIEAEFLLLNRTATDNEWSQVSEQFDAAVLGYLNQEGSGELRALPNDLSNIVYQARKSAAAQAEELSLWADINAVVLKSITVTSPYYPVLSSGTSGATVKKLQQRLIDLGYLEGEADGHFGPKTKTAIESVQTYIRALEQDAIDAAMPAPTPTPEPTPEPTPNESGEQPDTAPAGATPVPAPTPTTVVDGAIGETLQAYLYSDSFPAARTALNPDEKSDAVQRMQRRLIQLGYLTGTADGHYGGNTQRGVYLFEHYNALTTDGIADLEMQLLLFSTDAKGPDYPLMTAGSSGQAVTDLQKRLRVLGFYTGEMDGDYGASTKTGVENLQTYMREKEKQALLAEAMVLAAAGAGTTDGAGVVGAAPTDAPAIDESRLTIEVNGIADPLLLEAFYADSFPAMSPAMREKDNGIEVMRLQRRLRALEYLFTTPDGDYGGKTTDAVTKFQARNNLPQTGIADDATIAAMYNEDALKALKPYVLKVSISDQRVYAYGLDSNNEHTVLARTMICSTGRNATPTPKGTYQASTGPGARWHYFKKFKCWAQYAYYIQGDIMFHSVLYGKKNGSVTQSSVRNLGSKASHGCVRLKVEDAKWIWENCPPTTKIIVY